MTSNVSVQTASNRAPTLEELPPEKGTILELHSIGSDDFDGMVVVFHSVDKKSGKFFVTALDTDQSMSVKSKCCRRPEIKPLHLRQVLHDLSETFIKEGIYSSAPENLEASIEKLKQLLDKDPVSVPVHQGIASLALFRERGENGHSESTLELTIKHYRIGIANFHAYHGVNDDSDLAWMQRNLASLLAVHRGLNSAARYFKSAASHGESDEKVKNMSQVFLRAQKLHAKAKDETGERLSDLKREKLASAAEHYLLVLEEAPTPAEIDGASKLVVKKMLFDSEKGLMKIMSMLGLDVLAWQEDWDSRFDAGSLEDPNEHKEIISAGESFLFLIRQFVKTYTHQDGKELFLADEVIAEMRSHEKAISEHIQSMKSLCNKMEAPQNELIDGRDDEGKQATVNAKVEKQTLPPTTSLITACAVALVAVGAYFFLA